MILQGFVQWYGTQRYVGDGDQLVSLPWLLDSPSRGLRDPRNSTLDAVAYQSGRDVRDPRPIGTYRSVISVLARLGCVRPGLCQIHRRSERRGRLLDSIYHEQLSVSTVRLDP